jgi:Fic family protein
MHLRSKLTSFQSRSASIRQARQDRLEAESRADEAEVRADEAEFRAADLQRQLNAEKVEVSKALARCASECYVVHS